MLNLNSRITRNSDLVSSEVGEDTVLLDVEAGRYYGLDRLGSWVWSTLSEPHTVDALSEKMVASYEVELDQARQDLLEFLGELESMKLISSE